MDAYSDPQYKTADGAALRIWRDAAPNNFLTEQLGRALFDEVIMVEVITPGSRDSTPVFEVERSFCPEMHHPLPKRSVKYAEYLTYIEDFKKAEDGDGSLAGTPLKEWSEMKRPMVAALRAQNIFTIEALAALPDTKLTAVGPDGRTWREKAKAYLEKDNPSYVTSLAARLETMETEAAAGREREATMAARIQELENAKGVAKGKPVKPEQDAEVPAPSPVANEAPKAVAAEGETLVAATGTKATPII